MLLLLPMLQLYQLLENLIEAVNILGSVFYGTILGIFLVAFFTKKVSGNNVFIAAIAAQLAVFILFAFYQDYIAYLWFNVIGCGLVILVAISLSQLNRGKTIVTSQYRPKRLKKSKKERK